VAGWEERFGNYVERLGDVLGHADRRAPLRAYCKERLRQDRGLANAGCHPPFDPCALPKAMLVIGRAKDVSQPDS
jgi:hypothetical protein